MPTCKRCGDEVDELVVVKVDGKAIKLCSDCQEQSEQDQAVAEESEAVVQKMMDFKGRR